MCNNRTDQLIRMLLLWGDRYGANCTSNGRKLSIVERFRRYGWQLTLAGAQRMVEPCPFARQRGAEPLQLDCSVDDCGEATDYDGVCVLPGPSHRGLIESPKAIALIRRGAEAGLVVSGWCRGVRVLAAADVLRDKRVVGHADDKDAIEAAGGIYVGHDHPPVIDGRLVTGARSYFYRAKNADAIRTALAERRAA